MRAPGRARTQAWRGLLAVAVWVPECTGSHACAAGGRGRGWQGRPALAGPSAGVGSSHATPHAPARPAGASGAPPQVPQVQEGPGGRGRGGRARGGSGEAAGGFWAAAGRPAQLVRARVPQAAGRWPGWRALLRWVGRARARTCTGARHARKPERARTCSPPPRARRLDSLADGLERMVSQLTEDNDEVRAPQRAQAEAPAPTPASASAAPTPASTGPAPTLASAGKALGGALPLSVSVQRATPSPSSQVHRHAPRANT